MKIKSFVHHSLKRIYEVESIRGHRKKYVKDDLLIKSDKSKELTHDQKKEIQEFWNQYYKLSKTEWRWFEIYNNVKNEFNIAYFIPNNIWYQYVDIYFSNPRKSYAFDDKNLYDLYFNDIKRPKTICRRVNGITMNNNYIPITNEEAIALCKRQGYVILKIAKFSEGGKGIAFYNASCDDDSLLQRFLTYKDVTIQEVITQHDALSKLHRQSINTIRIISLFYNNEVKILSSVLRMGIGESKVDNASSGGIVCGILPNGQLKDYAFDTKGNRYNTSHPNGCRFADIVIPNYSVCLDIVSKLACRMNTVSSLISWDFAVDKDGDPILIEANFTFGEIDFHQLCNGPILGEMTENILSAVLKK